jgi:hypothetical protein
MAGPSTEHAPSASSVSMRQVGRGGVSVSANWVGTSELRDGSCVSGPKSMTHLRRKILGGPCPLHRVRGNILVVQLLFLDFNDLHLPDDALLLIKHSLPGR